MENPTAAEVEPPGLQRGEGHQASVVVDCRDQLCPKPILMVKRAFAAAPVGETLEVVVNERVAKENVLKYCWNHGQEVFRSYEDGPDFHILVRRGPEALVEKPMPVVGPCGARWD
jgi:TusA-related sulfurtransferase